MIVKEDLDNVWCSHGWARDVQLLETKLQPETFLIEHSVPACPAKLVCLATLLDWMLNWILTILTIQIIFSEWVSYRACKNPTLIL